MNSIHSGGWLDHSCLEEAIEWDASFTYQPPVQLHKRTLFCACLVGSLRNGPPKQGWLPVTPWTTMHRAAELSTS